MMLARQMVIAAHAGPSLVVTIVALGLAVASGASPAVMTLVVVAVAAGQMSIGWSNDWFDGRRGLDAGRPDKPIDSGGLQLQTVRTAALVSLAACTITSALLGPLTLAVHLCAVAGGWAYNIWLKASPGSVMAYLFSFGLLPSIVTSAVTGRLAPGWATVAAACFGAGVHFANVLPDLADDMRSGVRGLPQLLGVAWSTAATIAFLALGVGVVLLSGPPLGVAPALLVTFTSAVLLVGVALASRQGAFVLAFKLSMATGLVLVGLLVANGAALV